MLWLQIKLAIRFQGQANGRIARAPDDFKLFSLRGHISLESRPASVYDNIARCPAGYRMKYIVLTELMPLYPH